jgi:hypothetical protein
VTVTAATASSSAVKFMQVYVDNVLAYQANATATINAQLTLSAGTHFLVVQAYNGSYIKKGENIIVSSGGGGGGGGGGTGPCALNPTNNTLTICAPSGGSTVGSPVRVAAGVTSSAAVQFMQVYVDNVLAYSANQTSAIDTQLNIAAGTHFVVVQAYNGAYIKTPVTFTVSGGTQPPPPPPPPPPPSGPCALNPTNNTLTICTPVSGSTLTSPVEVSAGVTSSATVQFMQVYVDNALAYQANNTSTIDTSLSMTNGNHFVVVQAYNGGYIKTPTNITVGSGASGGGGGQTTCIPNPTNNTLTICAPTAGSSVGSPIEVTAAVTSSAPVQFIQAYVDNVLVYTVHNTAAIDTPITVANGTHLLVVQAYNGAYIKTPVTFTVGSGGGGGGGGGGNPPPAIGMFTSKFDLARTGLNNRETVLTPAVVSGGGFGLKGQWPLDAITYTQPLVVPSVSVGNGVFNVVYVGTENGSVYAFNADAPGSAPLWKRSFINPSAGINPGSGSVTGRTGIGPTVSITGTPVIDATRNAMYVSVLTNENGTEIDRLHEIDIRNGNDMVTPSVIAPQVGGVGAGSDGNGNIQLYPPTQNQRAGLALANNVVWVLFGSFNDTQPYHGWVVAFDAGTLQMIDAYNTSPDTSGGGVWLAGSGPAVDTDGTIYVSTGNGGFTGESPSNSVLKLGLVSGKITLLDYFSPFNTQCLSGIDLDLSSGGPMLLPDGIGGKNLLVVGGKEGRIYLLDRNGLGKFSSNDAQVVQSILLNPTACGDSGFVGNSTWRIYGSAAWWNGNVYLGSTFGPLRQYSTASGQLSQTAVSQNTFQGSGNAGRSPMPVVSSNGGSGAIVWTAQRALDGTAWLWAYDATDISKTLYSVQFGSAAVFAVPTVINGKVYVVGRDTLYVFGP